ncbi:10941_t:CDS:2 [Funneliformis caledonium]|uniref:10941_t:CDS:1 n=1 Tax=Funneliformis caledonium TaxID=1117310 RepID=A0A9N9IDP1_9GLOM|nr:10941_t:CDS:2 [Funneliformis caledonium]
MKSSHFKEDAINKLLGQDVDGWLFLKLTEEKLTCKNGPYEFKPGPAERIIELVERLKEKQVITATEFEKFCENNKRQLEKLNKMMNTVIIDIDHLSFDINTTKEDIRELMAV